MGNGIVGWFSRSYKGIIIGLLAVMAAALVVLAMQHVSASRADAEATPAPIPTFESSADSKPLAYFLGDSYSSGYGADSPKTALPYKIASRLDWRATVDGIMSTGYLDSGATPDATFPDRASKATSAADYLVVMGGVNDADEYTANPAAFRAAVSSTFDKLTDAAPDATLIVVGPYWPYDANDSTATGMDDAVKAAAAEHDAVFLDALRSGWMQDAEVTSNMADKLHPNQKGYDALADRVVADLRARELSPRA